MILRRLAWPPCKDDRHAPQRIVLPMASQAVIAHIYAHASTREHMADQIPMVGQISWGWNGTINVLGASLIWDTSTPSREKTVQRNWKKKKECTIPFNSIIEEIYQRIQNNLES